MSNEDRQRKIIDFLNSSEIHEFNFHISNKFEKQDFDKIINFIVDLGYSIKWASVDRNEEDPHPSCNPTKATAYLNKAGSPIKIGTTTWDGGQKDG